MKNLSSEQKMELILDYLRDRLNIVSCRDSKDAFCIYDAGAIHELEGAIEFIQFFNNN